MAGTITRWAHVAALAALMALPGTAPVAAPVPVAVQEVGFVLPADSGYGPGNTRLGVTLHAIGAVMPWSSILDVGQSFTFRFGSLLLSEEGNHNATITAAETRHLGVQARFGFGTPLEGEQVLLGATVTAWPGPLRDPAVDYEIHWDDVVLGFGNGGRLALSMSDVSFAANYRAQDQFATLTLLQAPARVPDNDPGGSPVEEPNLLPLAVLGLGAAALVGWRRRGAAGAAGAAGTQRPLPAAARAENHFPRIPRIHRRATAG